MHDIASLFDRSHSSIQRILTENGGIRPRQRFLTRPFRDWLAFFKPGFHPWQQHRDLDINDHAGQLGVYIA